MNDIMKKTREHSLKIGDIVIAGLLTSEDIDFQEQVIHLSPDYFYNEFQKKCIIYMNELYKSQSPINSVTLTKKFIDNNENYQDKILKLYENENITTRLNFDYYVSELKKCVVKHDTYIAGKEIQKLAGENGDILALTKIVRDKFEQIENEHIDLAVNHVSENLSGLTEYIENRDKITGISTGFEKLDKITKGLQGGKVYIIAARPSVGKSALMGNIIENLILNEKKSILLYGLEMPAKDYITRMVISQTEIPQRQHWHDGNSEKYQNIIHKISDTKLYINNNYSLTVFDIRSQAKKIKSKFGLDCLAIDYLQLINAHANSKSTNRNGEISEITRELKLLSMDIDIPIILLSQLSRIKDNRAPILADLRDSGAIEQDADVVIFLHPKVNAETFLTSTITEIYGIIAKNRGGQVARIEFTFDKEIVKFYTEAEK